MTFALASYLLPRRGHVSRRHTLLVNQQPAACREPRGNAWTRMANTSPARGHLDSRTLGAALVTLIGNPSATRAGASLPRWGGLCGLLSAAVYPPEPWHRRSQCPGGRRANASGSGLTARPHKRCAHGCCRQSWNSRNADASIWLSQHERLPHARALP